MPLELRFKATPDPMKYFAGIKDIARQLHDFREPFRQLVPVVGSEMARTIRERGAPIGAPSWPAHSPATIRRYGAGQHALLQRRGRLLREVYRSGKRRLSKTEFRYGPNKKYQFVQQFGSGKRGIPARPFIGLTEPMIAIATALMDQHVARILAAAWTRIGSAR